MALVMNPNATATARHVAVVKRGCSEMSEDSMDVSEEDDDEDECASESLSPGSNRNSVFSSIHHLAQLEVGFIFLYICTVY